MHVGIRHLDHPPVVAARRCEEDPRAVEPAGTWVIEELPSAPQPQAPITARDRRIVLALALGGVLIASGFVGRWLDQGDTARTAATDIPSVAVAAAPTQVAAVPAASPAPRATLVPRAGFASLVLSGPDEGATIEGAVVPVSVLAREPVGTVHLAVVLAHGAAGSDTELGAADVRMDAPGTAATRIAVFAPPVALAVELVVSNGGRAAPVMVRRALILRPISPVQLWRAEVAWSDDAWVLAIAGDAPLAIPTLRVRVSGPTGALLAEQRVVNGRSEAAPPGSAGGHALGLASFGARLPLAGARAGDQLTLRLAWRDLSLDEAGSTTIHVLVPGPELHPCPLPPIQGGVVVPPGPVREAGPVQSVPLGASIAWCRPAGKR